MDTDSYLGPGGSARQIAFDATLNAALRGRVRNGLRRRQEKSQHETFSLRQNHRLTSARA